MPLVQFFTNLHHSFFKTLTNMTDGWLLGLLARFTFLAVLFMYFINSAKTKVGEGFAGFFSVQDGAYFQILGEAGMIAYEFDTANIPFYVDFIVYMGTYMEFLLPILIVIGLFTRIAAIGTIIFIIVQTYVDINIHNVDAGTIGALFDREASSLVMDQRALWIFLLIVLVVKGAGKLSIDTLASRWYSNKISS